MWLNSSRLATELMVYGRVPHRGGPGHMDLDGKTCIALVDGRLCGRPATATTRRGKPVCATHAVVEDEGCELETSALVAQCGHVSREPLHRLFAELVEKNYSVVGIRDADITAYVADLLNGFVSVGALYAIRGITGHPLASISEMLAESDPLHGNASSFDREWQVRKHIGDFALMFTGMFPESLSDRRRMCESLMDYVAAGKESYYIVSQFERLRTRESGEPPCPWAERPWSRSAPLFTHLAADFERCMYGLNLVRSELDSFNDPIYHEVRRLLN